MIDRLLFGGNEILWLYFLLPCVFLFGLVASFRTGFFQITRFPRMLRETLGRLLKKEEGEGSVTPFQALCTALGGTVGTGSVVGTCQAIAVGGPGALFWMWIAAFFGMLIKFFEVTLAIAYRKKNAEGEWVGGPMYYILEGMGKRFRPLALLFALFALFSSLGMGCLAQANGVYRGICDSVTVFLPALKEDGALPVFVGIGLAIFLLFALFGGAGRIGRISEVMVPFACLFFISLTLGVLWVRRDALGPVLSLVVRSAFSGKALLGAGGGIAAKVALQWGLRRAAFSNEAGLGSAAIAHASAKTDHPVRQGFFGMFEVFADTMVVCTLTGLAVLVCLPLQRVLSYTEPDATLITEALSTLFGASFARVSMGLSLALFAFSTLVGWSLYGARCAFFLFGRAGELLYRFLFILCALFGAVFSMSRAWALADLFNGLMAIPNLLALIFLFPKVMEQMKDFFSKRKREKDLTQPPLCDTLTGTNGDVSKWS